MSRKYVNGSDMLLMLGTKAVGHCTGHTTTYTSETKSHAVKPAATADSDDGLWEEKSVSGLSYSIKSDSLMFYNETEFGFADALAAWASGETITVKCIRRKNDTKPYLTGPCVISSIEEGNPARDDSTFSIALESAGKPTIDTEQGLPDPTAEVG